MAEEAVRAELSGRTPPAGEPPLPFGGGAPEVTTLLLDLDGTLVDIDQRSLALRLQLAGARRFAAAIPPWRFRQAYVKALAAARSNGSERTNHEVFLMALREQARSASRLDALMQRFTLDDLPRLRPAFTPVPGARETVVAARELGYRLAIATNPLWPLSVVKLRLACAGLADVPFRFIAHSEILTRCKPSKDYYLELLKHLSVPPEQCVMVGNDAEKDLPAADVGIRTFIVGAPVIGRAGALCASGALSDLLRWLICSTLARRRT